MLCAANTHVAHVQHHGSYPLSPAQQSGFDFSTPSPDDRAKAAGPTGVTSQIEQHSLPRGRGVATLLHDKYMASS